MIKLALVGDIGSGKSYISKLFKYPIFNADVEVSKIYLKDKKCFRKIKKTFPNIDLSFPIKKKEIINCIIDNSKNLNKISKIIHPIIRKKLKIFIKRNKSKKVVILDIPLFLENKLNDKSDIIIFVQANKNEIRKRLFKRKGFNKKLFNLFKKIQLPLYIKKKNADFVIKNNFSNKLEKKSVKYILNQVLK